MKKKFSKFLHQSDEFFGASFLQHPIHKNFRAKLFYKPRMVKDKLFLKFLYQSDEWFERLLLQYQNLAILATKYFKNRGLYVKNFFSKFKNNQISGKTFICNTHTHLFLFIDVLFLKNILYFLFKNFYFF